MLGSGSRSYYDDYVRKKGTSSASGAGAGTDDSYLLALCNDYNNNADFFNCLRFWFLLPVCVNIYILVSLCVYLLVFSSN